MRVKDKIKFVLREIAKQLRVKIKYVDYLPDRLHGMLLVREKRILINARKPRCEHIFTLLHEFGHYLMHGQAARKVHHPRFFDIDWKNDFLNDLFSKIRRCLRFMLNKESGKEWQADLWATCAFLYIAKHFGCRTELIAFLNRHPEKISTFLFSKSVMIYCDSCKRIKKALGIGLGIKKLI